MGRAEERERQKRKAAAQCKNLSAFNFMVKRPAVEVHTPGFITAYLFVNLVTFRLCLRRLDYGVMSVWELAEKNCGGGSDVEVHIDPASAC